MVFFSIMDCTSGPDLRYEYSYTSILLIGLATGDTPDTPHYHLETRGPSRATPTRSTLLRLRIAIGPAPPSQDISRGLCRESSGDGPRTMIGPRRSLRSLTLRAEESFLVDICSHSLARTSPDFSIGGAYPDTLPAPSNELFMVADPEEKRNLFSDRPTSQNLLDCSSSADASVEKIQEEQQQLGILTFRFRPRGRQFKKKSGSSSSGSGISSSGSSSRVEFCGQCGGRHPTVQFVGVKGSCNVCGQYRHFARVCPLSGSQHTAAPPEGRGGSSRGRSFPAPQQRLVEPQFWAFQQPGTWRFVKSSQPQFSGPQFAQVNAMTR
ncbi:hypothetical protein F511_14747 [Dorcoceras hygrometricum]|uniref:CCHC-type domain-containing protein n=1 Tax=Dorcoceras hygrometricum TaxID=472368 RepID=A0A2Z7ASJ7_9LAMI|nr:hypothetical protein F511_14747 [Dorcoceras hygrometricum]